MIGELEGEDYRVQENRQTLRFASDVKMASVEKKETEEMKYHGLTIQKRPGRNTWSTRYRLNGKQYYLSGATQKEVVTKLKEVLGIKEKIKFQTYTFENWFNDWINLYKKDYVRPGTLKEYNSTRNRLSEGFKAKDINKITSDDIMSEIKNVDKIRARQKTYETLKLVFDQAFKTEKIERNPINVILKPKYTRERGVALTKDECDKFVNKCKEYGLYVLILILYQGYRTGEALGICGEDIDLENKIISINKSFNDRNNFDITKNKHSVRYTPIFKNSEEILKTVKITHGERVFKYSQSSLREKFDKVVQELHLPDTLRISDLRHTFISKCQSENIPEHIIQGWVGHTVGSKVTKRTYTHITSDANLFYINKLNDTF